MSSDLFDAHCHLLEPWFTSAEIVETIRRAQERSVKTIVNVASFSAHYQQAISLGHSNPSIFANIGLQPTHVSMESFEVMQKTILMQDPVIKAIGEVGLDYYWVKESSLQKIQRDFFAKIIEFANGVDYPLVVHSRAAEADAIELLERFARVPVLLHCWGSPDLVERSLNAHFLISIPTSVCSRRKFAAVAAKVPLDSMVLETDSPYQSPHSGKGRERPPKNEPSNIPLAAQMVADIKQSTSEDVARATTRNSRKFFRL